MTSAGPDAPPETVEELLVRARRAAHIGLTQEATRLYDRVFLLRPGNDEALDWLARNPGRTSDEDLIRAFRDLESTAGLARDAYAGWVNVLRRRGSNRILVADVLVAALRAHPRDDGVLAWATSYLLELGLDDDAARVVRHYLLAAPRLESSPLDADSVDTLVRSCVDLHLRQLLNESEIFTVIEWCTGSDLPRSRIAVAESLLSLQHVTDAEKHLDGLRCPLDTADLDSRLADLRLRLAVIFNRHREVLAAVGSGDDVSALQQYWRASAHLGIGEYGLAVRGFTNILERGTIPDDMSSWLPAVARHNRAAALYASGDFAGAVEAVRSAVTVDLAALAPFPTLRAGLIQLACALPSRRLDDSLRADLAWLEEATENRSLSQIDRRELRLIRASVLLERAGHHPAMVPQARQVARDTVARYRENRSHEVLAYLAALALQCEDIEGADQLLRRSVELGADAQDNWRLRALRALSSLRGGGRGLAAATELRAVVTDPAHNVPVDTQCIAVHEALAFPSLRKWAMDHARRLVTDQPGHVHARLVHGECLYRSIPVGKGDRDDDFAVLRDAAVQFDEAVALSDGLFTAYYRSGSDPPAVEDIGSSVLSPTELRFACLRAAHAGLRAASVLVARRLPRDCEVDRIVLRAENRFAAIDRDEARRIEKVRRSHTWHRVGDIWSRWLRPTVGLAAVAVAAFAQQLPPSTREGLVAAGSLLVLWSFISKLSVFGFELERIPTADRVATSPAPELDYLSATLATTRLNLAVGSPTLTGDLSSSKRSPSSARTGSARASADAHQGANPDASPGTTGPESGADATR